MADLHAALARRLEAASWPSVVLLYGDDDETKRVLIARMIAAMPDDERDVGVERFAADALARALDVVRTRGLFGGRRLVIVNAVTWLQPKGSEEDVARLVAHLDHPPELGTLVLVADRVDRRLAIVKRIESEGFAVECAVPSERDMPAWIAERVAAKGLELPPRAIQAIADAVGTDAALAARAVDKLALLVPASGEQDGRRPKLDLESVEFLLGPTRAVGAFALEDAVLASDAAKAVAALERHLGAESASVALPLLGRITSIARRLAVAEGVRSGGGGEDQVRARLGCHPFVAKKYFDAARGAGERGACGLAEAVRADRALKSGGDVRAALRAVVLAMTRREGAKHNAGRARTH